MSKELLTHFAAAIATGGIRVVDLTQTLRPATPVIQLPPPFAPSSPFRLEEISRYDERGPAWYWNKSVAASIPGRISTRRRTGSRAGTSPKATPTRCRCSA